MIKKYCMVIEFIACLIVMALVAFVGYASHYKDATKESDFALNKCIQTYTPDADNTEWITCLEKASKEYHDEYP